MNDLIKLIDTKKLGTYKENVSFKTLTSYKTGGVARLVVYPFAVNDLITILKFIKKKKLKYKVFGNGSNILASDKTFEGVIIKLSNLNAINIDGGNVEVEAGYNFAVLSNMMSKKGYWGLEFGGGIPANVGGAVYMNAGAYLQAVSDVLVKVDFLDSDYNIKTLGVKDLNYSYRHSIFMEKDWIILKAYFKLEKGEKEEIMDLVCDRKQRRMASQPLEYPSAGSVFRNPEGMYAGKLIEDCNLKGYNYGGAEISSKHANFIINKDGATSSDILYLMNLAKDKVKEKYGVELYREQELFNWEK